MKDKLYIPEIDSIFEILDQGKYLPKVDGKIQYGEDTDEYFLSVKEYFDGYQLNFYPKNSPFSIIKTFYKSGMIKKKGVFFNRGLFKKGKWYFFDPQGNLTETINEDAPYKFTFEELHEFLKAQNIPLTKGYIMGGFHTSISKPKSDNGDPVWYVEWLKKPDLIGTMTIDGKTGKVLKKEDIGYTNN